MIVVLGSSHPLINLKMEKEVGPPLTKFSGSAHDLSVKGNMIHVSLRARHVSVFPVVQKTPNASDGAIVPQHGLFDYFFTFSLFASVTLFL